MAYFGSRRSRSARVIAYLTLLFALIVGVLFMLPLVVEAATLDVCASGCSYTTIHDAIAAASAGDTINVHAGVYTETSTLLITQPLTLQGAGAGVTILRGNLQDVSIDVVPVAAGDTTIAGFTFEGNGAGHAADPATFVRVIDPTTSDTVTISHNLFQDDLANDPQFGTLRCRGVVGFLTAAHLLVTNNEFVGVTRGGYFEDVTGPLSVTNNAVHDLGSINTAGFEELNGHAAGHSAAHTYSDNTFSHYTGQAVVIHDVGVPDWDGVTIANNGIAITGSSPTLAAIEAISLGVAGLGITIQHNIFHLTGSIGGVKFLREQAAADGLVALITHNLLVGDGTANTSGVLITGDGTHATVNDNEITTFATGLSFTPSGAGDATVAAAGNCVYSNTTFGANTTGTTPSVAASGNWWGAASGPTNSGNPGGTGDVVSDHITFAPFLTAPAPACSGPVASAVTPSPNPANTGVGATLTASLSTNTTSTLPVASAQFNVDGGAYGPMSASDGSFDTSDEAVMASLPVFASEGTHFICVRGMDSAGHLGAPVCASLTVQAAAPTATPTPTATVATTAPTATATTAPTATATPEPTATAAPGLGGKSPPLAKPTATPASGVTSAGGSAASTSDGTSARQAPSPARPVEQTPNGLAWALILLLITLGLLGLAAGASYLLVRRQQQR